MLAATACQVQAVPITVAYTVTGSTGNYDLGFSVTNNMLGTTQAVYFFGVELSAPGIIASPPGYNPDKWPTWGPNSSYGGSSTIYNNNWIDVTYGNLFPGTTLSGFNVHVTDAAAPTSVKWFAFGYGSEYLGGDNFSHNFNPLFEGEAFTSAVPEPSSIAVFGFAASGLLLLARRKRQQKKLSA